MQPVYFREAFTVEIEDGNVICTWSDGMALSMPIRIARENIARCQKAIEDYDAHACEIVSLRRARAQRRRAHSPSRGDGVGSKNPGGSGQSR